MYMQYRYIRTYVYTYTCMHICMYVDSMTAPVVQSWSWLTPADPLAKGILWW